EQAISGREIECAVLDARQGRSLLAGAPGEIVVHAADRFYDYAAKYVDNTAVELICPAKLPDSVSQRIRSIALAAFTALGCEGLARVDFFWDTAKDSLLINEVNTMPGFTPYSLYARMMAEVGWPYNKLVGELIELALDRPVGLR
ncbi:MAG: ATP-grasp domain-containing protein, partial [Bifidobacteriaceae bacterium]|nr:ATP-grasp domain-containing protein [Bifidobacteriaceae bacterium]